MAYNYSISATTKTKQLTTNYLTMEKTKQAPSGNIYTDNTITINGKTFKLKRDKLSQDLTNALKNIKK